MFYVIELQTNGSEGNYLVTAKETRDEAMSTYHSVLAAAAVSAIERHACIVIDDRGTRIANECYEHGEQEL